MLDFLKKLVASSAEKDKKNSEKKAEKQLTPVACFEREEQGQMARLTLFSYPSDLNELPPQATIEKVIGSIKNVGNRIYQNATALCPTNFGIYGAVQILEHCLRVSNKLISPSFMVESNSTAMIDAAVNTPDPCLNRDWKLFAILVACMVPITGISSYLLFKNYCSKRPQKSIELREAFLDECQLVDSRIGQPTFSRPTL